MNRVHGMSVLLEYNFVIVLNTGTFQSNLTHTHTRLLSLETIAGANGLVDQKYK